MIQFLPVVLAVSFFLQGFAISSKKYKSKKLRDFFYFLENQSLNSFLLFRIQQINDLINSFHLYNFHQTENTMRVPLKSGRT